MSKPFDVIIIGAGPSGSTAAKTLADRGYSVLLVDKAVFPRHKVCASWVNMLVFERFPYLKEDMASLVDCPFYGIRFYDQAIGRSGVYLEKRPSGFLTLRSKFDHGVKIVAQRAGAMSREGTRVRSIEEQQTGVRVTLDGGEGVEGRFLIGADGANSQIAFWSGLRKSWRPHEYVLCANEDIPYDPARIEAFYGSRFPLLVSLRFHGLEGYGWVFPKREYICVGIGGRGARRADVRGIMSDFCESARQRRILPADVSLNDPDYALDPAGAVHQLPTLTRGRTVLIGDAGGFVSGSTGEGIYPGMVSGAIGRMCSIARLNAALPTFRNSMSGGVWSSAVTCARCRVGTGNNRHSRASS